jgi:hypothetical protein
MRMEATLEPQFFLDKHVLVRWFIEARACAS